MPVASFPDASERHPWLAALIAAPETELNALVGGFADIPPYGRAEPADAAASLLFGLGDEDPALLAFDQGCLALLERFRRGLLEASAARYPARLAALDRLFAVIRRTSPPLTIQDLHRRYVVWMNLLETSRLDEGLDPRREYLRLLALTQALGGQGRRRMPQWLEICAEAGPLGRYPTDLLDIGLLGLRRLPLAKGQDGNEEAVCHGLARWAAQQRPDKGAFLARWREIESAYPRGLSYWPPLIERVIATVETHLTDENSGTPASFVAAAWWREELELAPVSAGRRAPLPARRGPIEPPSPALWQALRRDAAAPIASLTARVTQMEAAYLRYTDATGDPYYLIRSACNVGMALLQNARDEATERGAIATRLARLAMEHEPANAYAWALWRDGVAAQGQLATAEAIGWEAIRRSPEDPQWRNQLATLLAEQRGRPEEAAQLLRDTRALFPQERATRSQLARLPHEWLGRPEEARTLLEEALQVLPDDRYNYGDLAVLLADHFNDRHAAERVLLEHQWRFPNDKFGEDMLQRLRRGGRLRRPPDPRPPISSADDLAGSTRNTAAARRAVFRAEAAGDQDALAEVRRLMAEDPSLAYLRYAGARLGASPPDARPDTAFAFAFQGAVKTGSAEAFEALTRQHSRSLDGFVARVGLTLVTGGRDFALPPGAYDAAAGSQVRRFVVLTGGLSQALAMGTTPAELLRLVADVPPGGLSLAA